MSAQPESDASPRSFQVREDDWSQLVSVFSSFKEKHQRMVASFSDAFTTLEQANSTLNTENERLRAALQSARKERDDLQRGIDQMSTFGKVLGPVLEVPDLLTADAKTLATGLRNGDFTSVNLVLRCCSDINAHDEHLHAMLSMVPFDQLGQRAEALDQERKEGKVRGPLHGIPIVINDNIATLPELGMETTCGSWALHGMTPTSNAGIVDKLIEAGLIIIGKTNMSEWAYYRNALPSGWSGKGGQCQSAYVRGGVDPKDSNNGHSNPSGSSTGSAVAVSAGYAPLSIGTETYGSLVSPASRAALYTIKPSMGRVSQSGIIPISHTMESAGPMAKTPYDLAALLDVISGTDEFATLGGSWEELSIATIDFEKWWPGEDYLKSVWSATKQMHAEIQAAYDKMEELAKKYVGDIPLPPPSECFMLDGKDCGGVIMMADFKHDLNKFLESAENTKIHSLAELIEFNKAHPDLEMPPGYDDQGLLIDAEESDLSLEDYEKNLSHLRKVARDDGLDRIFEEYGVDVIVGSSDTAIMAYASGSGYPIGNVPLGYLDFNGRPFGLAVLAAKNQEAKIIKFMNAWEGTFGPRKAPLLLQ
ncbi:glu asp-tRNA amidotransferase subunit A [Fusarium pseudoanthophilum]|uniref:Glu asp-tRNA amidotransferase subunit A n=1 Tax=Fusarium pseudoanthophilum TaxID=48495 RepID=A0A8H5UWM9_9HYPO|nr:glu asp-tRNA amidotransferase subunit A [Fusarium pseudoanthophilum]